MRPGLLAGRLAHRVPLRARRRRLFVMGPLGESVRRVTTRGYGPDFTPDGKEIVYAEEAVASPLARGREQDLGGRSRDRARSGELFAPDAIEPAVSPHGMRVAFWGLNGDTAQRDVWTVPLAGLKEGEKPVPVTNDAAVDFSPFWSPDGSIALLRERPRRELQPLAGPDRRGLRADPRRARAGHAADHVGGDLPGLLPRRPGPGKRIAFTAPAELMTIEKLALDPATLAPAGPPAVLRRGSTVFEDLEHLARRRDARDADGGPPRGSLPRLGGRPEAPPAHARLLPEPLGALGHGGRRAHRLLLARATATTASTRSPRTAAASRA